MPRFSGLTALLLSCLSLSAKTFVAERYDVRIRVLPDASLAVTEAIRFVFHGGSFSFVTRDIAARGLDRIDDIEADMDGQPSNVDISNTSRAAHVRWNFNAAAESSHVFTVSYRVEGAIRGGILNWRAIPEQHAYPIEEGEIEIQYPADEIASVPTATSASTADRSRSRTAFTIRSIPPDRPVFVRAGFRPGFAPSIPEEESGGKLWNFGLAAGGFTLLACVLLLLRAWAGVPESTPIPPAPANPIPVVTRFWPGIAYRLAPGATCPHGAVGTLLDLARRGVVSIRAEKHGRFGRTRHMIEPRDLHRPLVPFESAVLDLARPPAPFDQFIGRLSGGGGRYQELVEKHMLQVHLIDPERLALRRRWTGAAAWLLVSGVTLGTLGALFLSASPRLAEGIAMVTGIAAGVAVGGVLTWIAAARIRVLTARGAEAASAFRAFREQLIALTRREFPSAAEDFERWLPYAVALGIGSQWVAFFRKEGAVPMPEWFSGDASTISDFAVFDFVSDAGASAAVSAGGGDGGGGSGGGSSSAG